MDLMESMEIYIPEDTEVKRISLRTLPSSMLRRMGLPLDDIEVSKKPAESPEGVFICPVVLRKKGQKAATHTESSVLESLSSLKNKDVGATVGPFRMSFVASNHAAYKMLKDTMPGKKVTHTSRISLSSPSAAPQTYREAVLIYQGRVYLSVRRHSRSQRQHETQIPQPAQSPVHSTSEVSSKRPKKRQSSQASLEPADKAVGRKRVNVTLPQISQKQPKELLSKTESHCSTDQERLKDTGPKKKRPTQNARRRQNTTKKNVAHKSRNVASSNTPRSVPQSSDSVHSQGQRDPRGERAAEEGPSQEPAWFQDQGEPEEDDNNDGEPQYLNTEEPESTSQCSDMDRNITSDTGEPEITVGVVDQGSNQSRSERESHSTAAASTSRVQEFDFTQLAQEEKIAIMKAKLKQKEVAFSKLQLHKTAAPSQ